MIYMKGVPEFPQCGFSSLAVRVLNHYGKCAYVQFYEKILLFLN
jgi:glutaredoxin-related protein